MHLGSKPTPLQPDSINLGSRNMDFFHTTLENIQQVVLDYKFECQLRLAGLCQASALGEASKQVRNSEGQRYRFVRHCWPGEVRMFCNPLLLTAQATGSAVLSMILLPADVVFPAVIQARLGLP